MVRSLIMPLSLSFFLSCSAALFFPDLGFGETAKGEGGASQKLFETWEAYSEADPSFPGGDEIEMIFEFVLETKEIPMSEVSPASMSESSMEAPADPFLAFASAAIAGVTTALEVSADLGTGRGPRIVNGHCHDYGSPASPTYSDGYYCWVGEMLRAYTGGNGYDCSEHSIVCVHPEPAAAGMGGTCFYGPDECDESERLEVVEAFTAVETHAH